MRSQLIVGCLTSPSKQSNSLCAAAVTTFTTVKCTCSCRVARTLHRLTAEAMAVIQRKKGVAILMMLAHSEVGKKMKVDEFEEKARVTVVLTNWQ